MMERAIGRNRRSRRPDGRLKFLIDEMHSHRVAVVLRESGFDAIAVTEQPGLRGTPDERLLELAFDERRVVVTENIDDFTSLARLWAANLRPQAGIVLTLEDRFPRHHPLHPEMLRDALVALTQNVSATDLIASGTLVWWLKRG